MIKKEDIWAILLIVAILLFQVIALYYF